ncbi:tetratricopeptide repeat protein [Methanobrevibacter thaueri]|uniref:Lipoprotein NlpI n=1 Tax=Methanobrevibacter thaueri TaxID=190975 RepID=A0A315XNS9_9EURY|nr:tetratricopeptide repeat protein [Methanobrevibacter thaueri]PWB88016.1 lipoprotein NlpI [Methanobrevibacter thaueri]
MSFLKDISLKNKKEYHKAQNFLEMGNYAEALDIFNTLLEKNFHVFYVLSNLIIIHKELNSLNVLLDKINDLMNDKQYNREELLIQKGYALYLLKDYDNAIECFDEVLNNDSDNLWACFYKFKVLKDMNVDVNFNLLFLKIKECDPDYYLSLSLGEFFLELGLMEESLFCFDLSLKKNSKNCNALIYKGLCLKEMGMYDKSLNTLDTCLELDPNNLIAWNYKGTIYNLMGKYHDALECFDKCLSIDSNSVPAIVNKATSYFHLGNIDVSLKCCEFALKLDSTNCPVWDNYATFLFHANRLDESLNAYDHALELCPKNINLLKNKLILLFNMGKWEEVFIFADEILNFDNELDWVEDYKRLALEELNKSN